MIAFLNFLIITTIIITFLTLIAGLIFTARAGDDSKNKINKFMKYRVYFQLVSIVILMGALFYKQQLGG